VGFGRLDIIVSGLLTSVRGVVMEGFGEVRVAMLSVLYCVKVPWLRYLGRYVGRLSTKAGVTEEERIGIIRCIRGRNGEVI
jgi:hypothetical protein